MSKASELKVLGDRIELIADDLKHCLLIGERIGRTVQPLLSLSEWISDLAHFLKSADPTYPYISVGEGDSE